MKASMGKLLRVDLTTRSFREEVIPEAIRRSTLGGIGLAVSYLLREIPAGADPLGPDNLLCFSSGLLTGTGSLMTGRWMVSCRSPLTGGWGDANCGGNLAPAIKRAGWDAIIFSGVASEPLVFYADEGGPRLEPAGGLWGRDAVETEEALLAAWRGKGKPAVAAIGPAAERLSLISGISNDRGRYAARSGVGAVMGSKRLKALVLSGSARIPVADPERVKALSKSYAEKIARQEFPGFVSGRFLPLMGRFLGAKTVFPVDGLMTAGLMKRWGTIFINTSGAVNGDSPMRNWGGSVRDFGPLKYRKLNPDRIIARETSKYRCYSCVIGCGGVVDVSDILPEASPGKLAGAASGAGSSPGAASGRAHSHKPEYETVCAFGPLCLNDDLDSIYRCNEICNRAGFDTISAGSVVAFAMECWERGILTAEDTGGLDLSWGNSKSVTALLELMAERKGIGDVLADGVRKAAERIGRGAERYAIHAGGQEPGMHDSRLDPMMGVAFSADPTPGRHTVSAANYYNLARVWEFVDWAPAVGRPYPKAEEYEATDREALKSAAGADLKALIDISGACLFALMTGLQHWPLFGYLNAATGLSLSPAEYLEAGRRVQTMRQLFNLKQGLEPRSLLMHRRLAGDPPLEAGPLAGRSLPIDAMVSNFWGRMGWSAADGRPLPETLEALGLSEYRVLPTG